MISDKRKVFFSWLSAGIATTSLALIIFIPNFNAVNDTAKWLSVTLLLISIPFSVATLFINKEIEVFEHPGSERIKGVHHTILLISLASYLVGFCAFCFSMQEYLLYVFLGALLVSYSAFRAVQNEIIRS